jgi:D-alanyl-D-alanine carboxypeptidase
VHFCPASLRRSSLSCLLVAAAVAFSAIAPTAARAEALLVVEADTGKVLQAENATYPWYPASVTKLMTTYVTLMAVKEGRLRLDSLLTVSPNAASQAPSKMGFPAGTQVTVENALAMIMVKSANDISVVLAEGVGGSVDGFSAMMNAHAQRLGMTQTSYVNPNGLPAEGQITSARDLAILARAIIRDLPEYEYFVHIPSMRYGKRVTQNFNRLIGRYPGADGMKTGFICASGFNLVATATRNGKRLIAVVLGASSSQARAIKAAQLLERGFSANNLSWLRPALGTVDNLAPIDAAPPNLRDDVCGPKRKRPASDESPEDQTVAGTTGSEGFTFFAAGLQAPTLRPVDMMAAAPAPSEPFVVYTGPKKTGAELIAAVAVDAAKQTPKAAPAKKRAGKKPAATAEAKDDKDKSGRVSVTIDTKDTKSSKPADKSAEKPAAAKPKPKAAAKPAPKPDAKPQAESRPAAAPRS